MKRDEWTARLGPHRIAVALLTCGWVLLTGCANKGSLQDTASQPGNPSPVGGVGGTGIVRDGIGGTGLVQNGVGGTGIVGVVTGFGSILVNGLELTFDRRTPTEVDGVSATSDALAVGKLVAVAATGSGSTLTAQRIVVVSAVEGPVQSVDSASGMMVVVGQRVHFGPATVLADRSGPGGIAPRPGDYVRVSGLRHSDGTVEAAYVERGPGSETVKLYGPLEARDGGLAVYNVPVQLGPGLAADAFLGQSVLVSGSWDGKTLAATSILPNPVKSLLSGVDRVSVQGYVSTHAGASRIDVAGLVLLAKTEARTTPGIVADYVLDQLGIVTGHFDPDGTLVIERFTRQESALPAGSRATPGDRGRMERPTRPERPSSIMPGGPPGGFPGSGASGGPPGGFGPGQGGGPPGCPPRCPPGGPPH